MMINISVYFSECKFKFTCWKWNLWAYYEIKLDKITLYKIICNYPWNNYKNSLIVNQQFVCYTFSTRIWAGPVQEVRKEFVEE